MRIHRTLPTKQIFAAWHTASPLGRSQNLSTYQSIINVGYCPYTGPPRWWATLWLTAPIEIGRIWPARATSDGAKPHGFRHSLEIGMDGAGLEETTEDTRHERARAVAGNFRLLPADRLGRNHLRPARRQRRQACQQAAPWRPHHHRNARPHPRLHGVEPECRRSPGRYPANARPHAGALAGNPFNSAANGAAHNNVP